jgi:hypothetical protein
MSTTSETETVTTSEVRHCILRDRMGYMSEESFDRWLTQHDRAVATRAWAEGYSAGEADESYRLAGVGPDPDVPHRSPYEIGGPLK